MARGFGSTDGVGTTDVVTTGYQTSPTQMTYSMWGYLTGAGGGNLGRFFDKDSAGAGKRQFFDNTVGVHELWFEVGFTVTDGAWKVGTAPATGAWHHYLITYDGSSTSNTPAIYIDGVSQTVNLTGSAPSGTIESTATNYLIGNRADSLRNFNGRLAEFAQWNRILNSTEIALLASGKRADKVPTPDFYYRLLGNDSPEPNYILGGSDGTLTGTAKQAHPTAVPVGIVAAGVVESLRTDTSDPMTWSHNQGTTAPKAVVVGFMHGTSSTDHVSTVTYGSKSLTRLKRNVDTATEPGAAEWWFGAGSIPTGTQTVTADLASGTTDDILGVSVTLEGDQALAVIDTDGIDNNVANPSVTLQYGGRYGMSFAALYSGLTDGTSLTAGTGTKKITSSDLAGNFTAVATRQTAVNSADFTIGVTAATDDVAYAAIAVIESEVLAVASGVYTISGTAATLRRGFPLSVSSGVYTLTGTTANLLHGAKNVAAIGSYILTGIAAALRITLNASSGTYSLIGTNAILSTASNPRLAVDSGAYTLAGTSSTPYATRLLTSGSGTYLVTGQSIGARATRVLTAISGSYTITGQNGALIYTPVGGAADVHLLMCMGLGR